MITLKVEDLTIKQIIKICNDQPESTCRYCPIKNYCHANFVWQPRFFDDNIEDEDIVNLEVNERDLT